MSGTETKKDKVKGKKRSGPASAGKTKKMSPKTKAQPAILLRKKIETPSTGPYYVQDKREASPKKIVAHIKEGIKVPEGQTSNRKTEKGFGSKFTAPSGSVKKKVKPDCRLFFYPHPGDGWEIEISTK